MGSTAALAVNVTLHGKHGGCTIRVGRPPWDTLQFLAEGKEPDARIIGIIAITDERIRQILTAAAEAAGLKKKLSQHWLRHAQRVVCPSASCAGGDHPRHARARIVEHDGPLSQFRADRWGQVCICNSLARARDSAVARSCDSRHRQGD
jgi:hypothetical protein